ncbi:MAG: chemotaxis protein CheD [Planctomycetes bacterium]|nr:chemotaxis protein CheD [Planctomycetota bacterium]
MASPGLQNAQIVGVADMAIAREPQTQLVTYALGSCIGLSAWDPVTKTGGLLHYMLPQPAEQGDPKQLKPFMYATTGIPLLWRKLTESGSVASRFVVVAAGGAEILEGAAAMAIGKRNRTILRKVLWKMGVTLSAEDTGGGTARTMTLTLATGEVRIRSREGEKVLWAPGMKVPVTRGIEP